MKNILALVGLVVVVFCGAGWALDWYKVVSFAAENGRYLVAVEINHQKIGEDCQRAQETISRMVNTRSQEKEPSNPTTNSPSVPGPNANAPSAPAPTTTGTQPQTTRTGDPSGGLSPLAQGIPSN